MNLNDTENIAEVVVPVAVAMGRTCSTGTSATTTTKTRYQQRTDFLAKLRDRGISEDEEINALSEDDLLNLDMSDPDRLIDVLSSSRFRDSLDSKIKEGLGVTTVDEKLRNDIIFSAYAELMVDDENDDEDDDEDMESDDDEVETEDNETNGEVAMMAAGIAASLGATDTGTSK